MTQTLGLCDHLWQSVTETFETMVPLPVERLDDPEPAEYNGLLWSSTITFTGDLQGCLTLLCSAGCAKKMARAMLMMDQDDPVEEAELKDALGEVTNLCIGGLKTRLLEEDCTLQISIPTVTRGRGLRPALGVGSQRLSLLVATDGHQFEFILAHK